MSRVIIAESAGFCPGVRAATDRLAARMQTAAPDERLYTLGHLIHNEDYNRELSEAGVLTVDAEALPAIAATTDAGGRATVFIRAHGITVQTRRTLEALAAAHKGFTFVDCTCPFVSKIHRIAADIAAKGTEDHVLLCIGNAAHPEVEGFMSCFAGEKYVLADANALEQLLKTANFDKKRPVMVAQTTQKLTEWKICQKVLQKYCTTA